MIYRSLGNTGLRVSQLGFGAMRLPMTGEEDDRRIDRDLAFPMLERALAAGVTYFDTAVGYCNGDSQRVVGEFFKGRRDQAILSTKNHCYSEDADEWWRLLEQSLERLQTDHIDIYNHHGINWERYCADVEPRLSKLMLRAKEQGLVRHICCSFHDNNEALLKLVDSGYPDVLTVQYNLLDQSLAEGIAHAHAKGIGIVVMGPVGGGRLGVDSEVLEAMVPDVHRVPELALRFVLANPGVSVALSGMGTLQHVVENTAVAADGRSLTAEELDLLADHLKRLKAMSDLYCSGCGYCKPCPQDIDIPAVFQAYNQGRVYGLWANARERYRHIAQRSHGADRCVRCGACEPKCPQNLKIAEELARAAQVLG